MMPHARVQITHPTWCRTDHDHIADVTDPRHLGPAEPMLCTSDDYEISVRLERIDEIHPDGTQHHGTTGVLLELTSLALTAGRGEPRSAAPFLNPADAHQLIELLTVFTDAAATDTTEVVW